MKEKMDEFLDLLKLNWKKCPWIKVQTMEFMLNEMEKEIKEVRAELKTGSKKQLEEELGDIAWDYFNLLVLAEKKKKIRMKNVFARLMKKVKHRKPYLFEKETLSVEESVWVWKQQKAKEKTRKH